MSSEQVFKFTEYLDLVSGESRTYKIVKAEMGAYEFAIGGDIRRGLKKVTGVRLHYVKAPGEPGPAYVDIGQQTLVAQILPFIDQWVRASAVIKITAFGAGTQKRFTVEQV